MDISDKVVFVNPYDDEKLCAIMLIRSEQDFEDFVRYLDQIFGMELFVEKCAKDRFEDEFLGKIVCATRAKPYSALSYLVFTPLDEQYDGIQEVLQRELRAIKKFKEAENDIYAKRQEEIKVENKALAEKYRKI